MTICWNKHLLSVQFDDDLDNCIDSDNQHPKQDMEHISDWLKPFPWPMSQSSPPILGNHTLTFLTGSEMFPLPDFILRGWAVMSFQRLASLLCMFLRIIMLLHVPAVHSLPFWVSVLEEWSISCLPAHPLADFWDGSHLEQYCMKLRWIVFYKSSCGRGLHFTRGNP